MKYFLSFLYLFLSLSAFAGEPLKIGVITDTHYLSENLMEDGKTLNDYIAGSGKNVKYVPAVLDKVINEYLQNDIEYLLVCGDMTKDGEKQSHLDFVAKLKPLQDKGVKIRVIPGNHDINMPNAVGFKADKWYKTDNISPADFAEIYQNCGYDDAIERDPASLSYLTSLNNDTWLLAIDAARYNEYKGKSISSGRILPETEKWIIEILDKAKKNNIQVIGMMHWGLTEHIMYQSTFFRQYLVDDWQRLANLFADKGMKAIFTGHFHSNDISLFTSDNGNKIYDIETGTLSAYPFSYRFVELYKNRMNIRTRNVTSIPQNPNLAEEDKQRMQVLSEKIAKDKLKGLNFGLPTEVSAKFANILSQIFALHIYGDEKPDEQLKQSLAELATMMDAPVESDEIILDFPPADNNVEIVF